MVSLCLIERRFNRLVYLSGRAVLQSLYRCKCGTYTVCTDANVKRGTTKSCGCLHRNSCRNIGRIKKHGHADTDTSPASKTYKSWDAMKCRTLLKSHQAYHRYGGRGITICERWLRFENFLADMGDRPEGKSLDRINNDGNYEPGNCRWSTAKEQANNRSSKQSGGKKG